MENIRSDEGFRVWVIHLLSEKLGTHAILKGGMVLRVLECPRYTNDLDYVFIPYKFKKDVVTLLRDAFQEFENINLSYALHSTSARFQIRMKNDHGNFNTQLEANVSNECETETISTKDFAIRHQQPSHLIQVMRYDVAFSNKIAAWLERRLMRDFYDMYYFYRVLGEMPHFPTLEKRLNTLRFTNKKIPKPEQKITIKNFLDFFRNTIDAVKEKDVIEELKNLIEENQLPGLEKKIKVAMREMIERLR